MKKLLTLALVLALTLSLAVPAFAAETVTTDGGSSTITVNGTYTPGSTATERVSVDVSWGAMSFTYTGGSEGSWNSTTHEYDGATSGSWTASTGNTITVTNHSNTAIEAELTFVAADGLNITGSFVETSATANDGKLALATAVGTLPANAPSATATFNITGGTISESGAIGTITVKITNK